VPFLTVKHLSDPSKNYTHVVHSLQQTRSSLYPHQAQGMPTLEMLLELLLCLIRRLSLHRNCFMKTNSPHTLSDVAVAAEESSSPTAGMNERGATSTKPNKSGKPELSTSAVCSM